MDSSYNTYGANNPWNSRLPGINTATASGTYWKGADGNVWVAGANGVNNAGLS